VRYTSAVTALLLAGLLLGALLGIPAAGTLMGFVSRALWTGVRLPDPPPEAKPDQRLRFALRLGFREWRSILGVLAGWPLGLRNVKPTIDPGSDRRPLLLVPGYGFTRDSMRPLQRFLATRGIHSDRWSPPLFAPPRQAAARLVERLRALSELAADQRVDIVAFGGGGLLVGEALAADPEIPVGRLVGVGTPWRGSPAAVFWPGAGAAAMLPDRPDLTYWNELLDTVLGRPLPPNPDRTDPNPIEVRRIAITSVDDLFVPPPLNRAPDGVPEIRLHGVGHVHLLHSRDAHEAIARALAPDLDLGGRS